MAANTANGSEALSNETCVSDIELLFGPKADDALAKSKVLVVGAGGIGCELLKNLVMSGFKDIIVVDLDTIDLSNLNRQFLFQRQHMKRPKSLIAAKVVSQFNPNTKTVAFQANIKDIRFNVGWFKQFDIVMNALDNLDARRHVNKMCLAADIPLVESGTAGYNGQATVIKGGETECFDCQEKPVEERTFPVCTIRSTPSASIHCIVWAKSYLFSELFSCSDGDQSTELHDDENSENAEELEALKHEAKELKVLRESMNSESFAQKVFEKVFKKDIERLLGMEDMWKNRRKPVALSYEELDAEKKSQEEKNQNEGEEDPMVAGDQDIPTTLQSFCLFVSSLKRLTNQLKEGIEKNSKSFSLSFDKDDDNALDFVTTTANLRATIFGIENKSRFQIKAMAGNIIPAIATTNAIVAGMMVTQAMFVISNQKKKCRTTFVTYGGSRPKYFNTMSLTPPNKQCMVCQKRRYLGMAIGDLSKVRLGDLVEYIQKLGQKDNNAVDPGLDIGLSEEFAIVKGNNIIYDPDFDDNLSKTFNELDIEHGSSLTVVSEEVYDQDDPMSTACAPVEFYIVESKENGVDQTQDRLIAIEGLEGAAKEYAKKLAEIESLSKTQFVGTKRKREQHDENDDVAPGAEVPKSKQAATSQAAAEEGDRSGSIELSQTQELSINTADDEDDDDLICLD